MDPTTGGPAFAVAQMVKVLNARGVSVDVATTAPPEKDNSDPSKIMPVIRDGAGHYYFPRQAGETWSLSLPLWHWLKRNIRNYDIVHIIGVFTFPALIAACEAKKANIPFIIKPAGTLDAYSLTQKAWRKKIYYRVFLKGVLDCASAIHATSESECNQLVSLVKEDACVVIPLSVMLPEFIPARQKASNGLRLLFLSRIHPKKGLPVLIETLSILRGRGIAVSLTVAGDGSTEYVREIKNLVKTFALDDIVDFAGFVEGESKSCMFREADLFVLPSHQENFGIAVVEAMASGLPVIVSDQVALADEIVENGAGTAVPVDMPEVLADEISAFLDSDYLKQTGVRARELVEKRFTADRQGQQLVELYKNIISDQ
jgi:glycosyltransferase involved in cell wall biosynthesis